MRCVAKRKTFKYDEVGNVAVEEVGYWLPDTKTSVARYYYSVVLIMTDGVTRVFLTKPISLAACEPELLAVHHFVFGRNNSHYTVPSLHSQMISYSGLNEEKYPSYYKFYL